MRSWVGQMRLWERKMLIELRTEPREIPGFKKNIFLNNGKWIVINKIKIIAGYLSVQFQKLLNVPCSYIYYVYNGIYLPNVSFNYVFNFQCFQLTEF